VSYEYRIKLVCEMVASDELIAAALTIARSNVENVENVENKAYRYGRPRSVAVELEVVAGGETARDFDALVNSLAALGEQDTYRLVIPWPRGHPEPEPARS
jgi:hypothetical protein